jgi:hypothetical protein
MIRLRGCEQHLAVPFLGRAADKHVHFVRREALDASKPDDGIKPFPEIGIGGMSAKEVPKRSMTNATRWIY